MKNIEQVRRDRDAALASAKAIALTAEADGRNLTAEERARAEAHLAKAREMAGYLTRESIPNEEEIGNLLGTKAGKRGPRWQAANIAGKNIWATSSYASIADATAALFRPADQAVRLADMFPLETAVRDASVLSYVRQDDDTRGPISGSSWSSYQVDRLEEKPVSPAAFRRVDQPFQVIAALSDEVSIHDLADQPRMSEMIGTALTDEVLTALDAYLLGEIESVLDSPAAAASDPLSSLRRGVRLLQESRILTSGCYAIVSPQAAEQLDTLKAEDSGVFMANGTAPVSQAEGMWGVKLLPSIHVTDSSTAIVISPASFGSLVLKQAPTVAYDASTAFTRDGGVFRCDLQAALAVMRPSAAVAITL